MAIEQKTLNSVSRATRSAYQKAIQVLDNNQLEYGITLLKAIVQREPGLIDARKRLRDAERQVAAKMNPIKLFFAKMRAQKAVIQGMAKLATKKPLDALACAEEALSNYLFHVGALNLMTDAAKAENAIFICVEAYELIVENDEKNEANMQKLGEFYKTEGDAMKYLSVCQKLAERQPNNLERQAALREAAARATMEQNRWDNENKNASFTDKLNKDNTDQGDRIIRAEEDVREMIDKYQAEVQAGNESIDLRRKLAELLMRAERYEEAIKDYDWIVQKMGTLDPSIDKQIEKANVAIARKQIEEMSRNGASEAEIADANKQVYDYRMERYTERIRKYPNDLQIRYEYAELLWEGGDVEGALEQFQIAQRNPQRRLSAIVYLGRCFSTKKQYDMAIEQFQKALADMTSMDSQKMDTLYYLGVVYDAMGRSDDAFQCFKEIYAADVRFKDVAERMKKYYDTEKK